MDSKNYYNLKITEDQKKTLQWALNEYWCTLDPQIQKALENNEPTRASELIEKRQKVFDLEIILDEMPF